MILRTCESAKQGLEEAVLACSLMPSELLRPSPLQDSDLDQLEQPVCSASG